MSWFYIGKTEQGDEEMTYQVVHEFHQLQEVGNPLSGQQVQVVMMPKLTVALTTKDELEAQRAVHYLNGGEPLQIHGEPSGVNIHV